MLSPPTVVQPVVGPVIDPVAETDVEPVYVHSEIHDLLEQLIDSAEHEEELRYLYTEIATSVDQSQLGRWLIGAARTRDRRAYRLSTKDGEFQFESLSPEMVELQRLRPTEFRHLMPEGWLPPEELHLKLLPIRTEVTTYTDDRKDVTFEFRYTGRPPPRTRQLLAHLATRAHDGKAGIHTTLDLEDLTLPESPCVVKFELPPNASLDHGASFYLKAYLPTPDARYYRISNVVPVAVRRFDIAVGHDADVPDIRRKIADIYQDGSEPRVMSLAAEVAAALQGGQQVRWVIRGGGTRDGQVWEVIAYQGKWLSQRAIEYRPEDVRGRGLSRGGDPYVGLPERGLIELTDAKLDAQQAAADKPWRVAGTVNFRVLRAEPVDQLMLLYRLPTAPDSPLDIVDTYQHFTDDDALPTGEQAFDIVLPPTLPPIKGGELFLIGFVQNEAEELQLFQLSNRVAWPE